MPRLTEDKIPAGKILFMGEPGSGKTGALLSLAAAGYKLRIIDTDNGHEILAHLAKAHPEYDIIVETITETFQLGSGRPRPRGSAYPKIMRLMDKFPIDWDKEGKATAWESVTAMDNKTVVVVDSLTRLGDYALAYAESLDMKHPGFRTQGHWGSAMEMQEQVLQLLCSDSVKAHVIVIAHVKNVEDNNGTLAAQLPSALGNKLPPVVASYFNTTLLAQSTGLGQQKKRQIFTRSPTLVETKTPAPNSVKPVYPQDTGLAEYFNDLFGPLKT